jgi:hypothetical protein
LFACSFSGVLLEIATWVQIDHLRFVANAPVTSVVNRFSALLTHVIQAVEAVKRRELLRALGAVDLYYCVCTLLFEHFALENCPLNYQKRLPKQFCLEISI